MRLIAEPAPDRHEDIEVRMKKVIPALGLAAIAALALSGCGGAAPAAKPAPAAVEVTDLDSLVEAAKAEGEVRVYAQIPEDSMNAFAEAFKEKYGITVDALRLGGNTLGSRFDTESDAGTPSGEVLIVVDVEFLATAAEKGAVAGFSDSGVQPLLDGLPEEAVFDAYDAPLVQVLETGFIYNTDKVDADEVPTSWDELESARWKGQYCAVDPGTSVNVAHFFWDMREQFGDEALAAFGAGIGRWYPNIVALNEAVAVGECALGLNSARFFVEMAKDNGAGVEFAAAPSVIPPLVSAGVATAAEHPHAARLFLHFIMSEEGNRLLNDPAEGSIGPWDTASLPAEFTAPAPGDFEMVRDATPDVTKALGL